LGSQPPHQFQFPSPFPFPSQFHTGRAAVVLLLVLIMMVFGQLEQTKMPLIMPRGDRPALPAPALSAPTVRGAQPLVMSGFAGGCFPSPRAILLFSPLPLLFPSVFLLTYRRRARCDRPALPSSFSLLSLSSFLLQKKPIV
jgi:hypothetical protein